MDLGLKGKLALVSGSTAGIGFAIAAALAKEGREGHRQRPHAGGGRQGAGGDSVGDRRGSQLASPATSARRTSPSGCSRRNPASRFS